MHKYKILASEQGLTLRKKSFIALEQAKVYKMTKGPCKTKLKWQNNTLR